MADLKEIKYVSPEKLGYYDSKAKSRMEAAIEAARAALQANITAEETERKAADLANEQAAQAAQAAAEAAQKTADDLATYVGEFESETAQTVIDYIDEKTTGIASDAALTELAGRVDQAEADIDALEEAVAANKEAIEATVEELAGKVEENEADIEGKMTALEERVADNETAVKTTLPEAIALKADQTALDAEIERATKAESDNAAAIKAIADDYLVEADKTALQDQITANAEAIEVLNGEGAGSVKKAVDDAINKFATDVTNDDVVNSYKELIDWAAEHGGDAAEMAAAIEALEEKVGEKSVEDQIAEAIEAENLDQYATDAELEEAVNRIVELEKVDHAHENAEVLDGITAEKVAAWDAAEANAKDNAEEKVKELAEGAVATNAADIDKLEESLAEGGATALAIKEAKDAADAAQADVDALEEVVETKADASALTELAGTVTTLSEAHATDKAALEAADVALDGRIAELEAVKHVEITEEEIDEIFKENP